MNHLLQDEIDTINVISEYPATGKGTVIREIETELKRLRIAFSRTEVGDLCRTHARADTPFGRIVKATGPSGMVPNEAIIPVVTDSMKQTAFSELLLVDGFPRNEGQIEAYEDTLLETGRKDRVIHLVAPRSVAEERMIHRGIQTKAAGGKVRPEDFDPSERKRRLDIADREMPAVIRYFEETDRLTEIDATQSIEEVRAQVFAAIFKHARILDADRDRDFVVA